MRWLLVSAWPSQEQRPLPVGRRGLLLLVISCFVVALFACGGCCRSLARAADRRHDCEYV